MPPCFSRPICQFAMMLNDEAKDADRQRLLPYVTRLACADTDEIEQRRQSYKILEDALAIGRQAEPPEFPAVEARMSAEKEKASTATSRADKPLLATIKQ